jgi:arylsulfatase
VELRNIVIGLVIALVMATEACSRPLPRDKPLNVLILYADDWRHDTLGCAGNPIVQTPNLDRLAREGIRFTHHCVTTSICGVSRANLFTGQWMSRHGNRAFNSFRTPWEETYPGLLRANGYYTGLVGKWHNGAFPAEEFDFGRAYAGRHWHTLPNGQKIHVTKRNQQDALEFLRTRPPDQPFCLTISFFAPHAEDNHPEQYRPQPESMALYNDVRIAVPVNATEESWKRLPPFFDETNEGRRRWRWRFDTPEKYQRMMKNYYRLVTEVDFTCEQVLDELRQQGILDQTLVIFTTDNGYFHAEHGLAGKWYSHQESIRVPLIIRDPRLPGDRREIIRDQLTLSVDLAPTILAATGIEAPDRMQGQDIAPLYLADEEPDWRTEFFYEHGAIGKAIPPSEALVRKDWKYVIWPAADYEQLFDLVNDPLEENDLARDPSHVSKLAELRTRFKELKEAAK